MLFDIPLWFAPSFYKLDLSEVPVLIGAFALGPLAGVVIELLKNILNFVIDGTITAGVGELANFMMGCSFVVPAAVIYSRKKTKKSAIIGLLLGTLTMILVASLLNAYVLLPVYAKAFSWPVEKIIEMGTEINKNIDSMMDFIILVVVPFNLVKGIIASTITVAIYKKLSPIIKGVK